MQLEGGGVVAVAGVVLFVFLQRLQLIGEVTNLGLVSSCFGSFDFLSLIHISEPTRRS